MKIEPSRDVLLRDLGEEAVLLDLKSQRYFGLDEVGLEIWRLLEVHQEKVKVINDLLGRFDVEKRRLESDFDTFIAELQAMGLVHIEGEGEDAKNP